MTLSANTLALAPGLTTSFHASGGVEPYTYSVVPGGAGGTIDASTGEYTAPAAFNADQPFDTIQAVDSDLVPVTVTADILIGTPLHLFCDVIQKELGLANGRVVLWDQKFNMPKDQDLVIAVRVVNPKPFGNIVRYDGGGSGLQAQQNVNMLAKLDINVMSRGPAARDRKEEVLLALVSPYSVSQQETNGFAIARLSNSFVDISEVDGAAIPYRFVISVNIQYSFKKAKAADYFNTFGDVGVTTEP